MKIKKTPDLPFVCINDSAFYWDSVSSQVQTIDSPPVLADVQRFLPVVLVASQSLRHHLVEIQSLAPSAADIQNCIYEQCGDRVGNAFYVIHTLVDPTTQEETGYSIVESIAQKSLETLEGIFQSHHFYPRAIISPMSIFSFLSASRPEFEDLVVVWDCADHCYTIALKKGKMTHFISPSVKQLQLSKARLTTMYAKKTSATIYCLSDRVDSEWEQINRALAEKLALSVPACPFINDKKGSNDPVHLETLLYFVSCARGLKKQKELLFRQKKRNQRTYDFFFRRKWALYSFVSFSALVGSALLVASLNWHNGRSVGPKKEIAAYEAKRSELAGYLYPKFKGVKNIEGLHNALRILATFNGKAAWVARISLRNNVATLKVFFQSNELAQVWKRSLKKNNRINLVSFEPTPQYQWLETSLVDKQRREIELNRRRDNNNLITIQLNRKKMIENSIQTDLQILEKNPSSAQRRSLERNQKALKNVIESIQKLRARNGTPSQEQGESDESLRYTIKVRFVTPVAGTDTRKGNIE